MFFSIILLVISVNLDALGVGLVYGIKKIHIPLSYKTLICIFSVLYSGISIFIGNSLSHHVSDTFGKYLGIGILVSLGIYSIFKAIYPKKPSSRQSLENESLFKIILKPLGISVHVVRNSPSIDIDNSGKIDLGEAILLSLALSVDSFGVGLGFSLLGCNILFIPFIIGLCQLIFLNIGLLLGNKVSNLTYNKFINAKTISILPGILLIILALFRL